MRLTAPMAVAVALRLLAHTVMTTVSCVPEHPGLMSDPHVMIIL